MSDAQIEAGKAYVAIYGDTRPLQQAMKNLSPEIKKHGEQLAKMGEETASTFSKGNKSILDVNKSAAMAAIALTSAAVASNKYQQSNNAAMTSTSIATQAAANATQRLVTELGHVAPTTRGFATAFNSLKNADVSILGGAFGVKSMLQLLGGAGRSADPLRKSLQGIIGDTKKVEAGLFTDYGALSALVRLARLPITIARGTANHLLGVDAGFGRSSAAHTVARQAQAGANLFGTADQKAAARQMGSEADAASIGAAFARGWVPGFAKYAQLKIPTAMSKIFTPSAILGAVGGAALAGPLGAALGGVAGRIAPGLLRSLAGVASGAIKSGAGLTALGNSATSIIPKLNTVHQTLKNVRLAAAGQGLSVAHGLGFGAFALAAAGAIGGVSSLAGHHNGEATKRIDNISLSASKNDRSAQLTSALDFAAGSTGTKLKTLDGAFDHLTEVMDKANEGKEKQIGYFTKLGLSAEALGAMSLDEKMTRVGKALASIKDPIERDKRALDLFGESGAEIVPMLMNLDSLKQKARLSGAIISTKDIEASKKMSLAIASLKEMIANAWNQIGAASIRSTTLWVGGAAKFLEKNQEVVGSLLKIVAGIAAAAGGVVLWSQFGGPVVAIIKAIGLTIAALMSPIGLVTIAIGAGVAAWMYLTESGRESANYLGKTFGQFAEFFKGVWGGIVAAVAKGDLALAGNIVFTALKLGFFEAISAIGGSWSAVMETIYGGANVLSNTITDVWFGAASTLSSIQSKLQKYFLMSFENIGGAWREMCLDMQDAFAPAQNSIAKSILLMAANFHRLLTGKERISAKDAPEAMKELWKSVDDETKGRAVVTQQQRDANRKKFTPGTLEAIDKVNADGEAKQAGIKAERDKVIADHQSLLAKRMAELKPDDKRIADLKRQLAGMIKQAQKDDSDPLTKPSPFKPDDAQLGRGKEMSVIGTFNAAAAAGMGKEGATSPLMQIVKNTGLTAKNADATKKAVEDLKKNEFKNTFKFFGPNHVGPKFID